MHALQVWIEPAVAVAIELRWARHEAGLTQAALAKRAGVSQQQIAKLESPGENPTIQSVSKVARALGANVRVSIISFVEGTHQSRI
jgi:transcriptional regulator with XRE-family HTH domain